MLMWNAQGPGGVARTVLNLSNRLARDRQVEIVSVTRQGRAPRFPIDPSVSVTFLEDESPDAVREVLRQRKPSVVISSRPVLHQTATRVSHGRHVLIGQEHGNFETRMARPAMKRVLEESLSGLDAMTVLTDSDARDYRALWPDAPAEIHVVHNALPFEIQTSVPRPTNTVVIAAGRLVPMKGFDRLIDAFAEATCDHPEWSLHICGQGPAGDDLQRLGDERGLGERLKLLGHVKDLDVHLRDAALLAMASRSEGFAMVLIEAMSQGLPTLAYDCPRGPGEVIQNAHNGLLIPDGDHPAYVAALRSLIEDTGLRQRLGAAGLERAADYGIDHIAEQWETLIDRLVEQHNHRTRSS